MRKGSITSVFSGLILFSALIGGVLGPRLNATAKDSPESTDRVVKQFSEVMSLIEQNYAESVDPERTVYSAINGMLRTLDPHSVFFDPKRYAELREEQQGKYYGVGMTIGTLEGRTKVLSLVVGAPAFRAGLRPGDVLMKVNNVASERLSTSEVSKLLRGAKGTLARIEVEREGSTAPLKFEVTRDEIPRPSIEFAYRLKDNVGYIRIKSFSETTDRELATKLKEIDEPTLQGLILDLRDNGGGILNEGIRVADTFLEKGQLVVYTKGRNSPERRFTAPNGSGSQKYPLVVLINQDTASAAEIVAGALQDHDRGLIIGETSFGKGLVQTVYPLDQQTGLALTVAHWYTPSGRLIQRDYSHLSLFDYYNGKDRDDIKPTEIKSTDSGRQVFGGGGIRPDVKVQDKKLNALEGALLQSAIFFNYTPHYLALHPNPSKTLMVDDVAVNDFRQYLNEQKFPYSETDLTASLEFIRQQLKFYILTSEYGQVEATRFTLDDDVEIQKAIQLMPQARELAANAKRVVAQRMKTSEKQ
ncbi:MAG: S41 family peptidase [Terriglobia bacterium]